MGFDIRTSWSDWAGEQTGLTIAGLLAFEAPPRPLPLPLPLPVPAPRTGVATFGDLSFPLGSTNMSLYLH